jgi:hypothetical protein
MVLEESAPNPVAVLWLPMVLKESALVPMAVLRPPEVLKWSAPSRLLKKWRF